MVMEFLNDIFFALIVLHKDFIDELKKSFMFFSLDEKFNSDTMYDIPRVVKEVKQIKKKLQCHNTM